MKTLLIALLSIITTTFAVLPFEEGDFYLHRMHINPMDPEDFYSTVHYFPAVEGDYGFFMFDPTTGFPIMQAMGELEWSTDNVTGLSAWMDGVEAALAANFDGQFSSLTGRPTTLSGYGISDPVVLTSGSYANPSWLTSLAYSKLTGTPSLAAVATSGSYNDLSNKPTIPTNNNQLTNGAGYLTAEVDGSSTNEIELPSQTGNSGKVLTTNGSAPAWTGIGSLTPKTFNFPTRSLNTSFQVSATQDAFVSYTIDVGATLTLTGGQSGTVTLQYADNSGMSTNLTTVQSSVNGNTGTLAIGLSLTQTSTASLAGMIPAGKWVRIASANTSGTPTFTYRAAQEVLF